MIMRLSKPILAFALAAISAAATAGNLPPGAACAGRAEIAGTEQVLAAGRTVLVGEGHGTNEMPDAFLRLVCSALRRGQPVAVGLEMHDLGGALGTYMASTGDPEARQAFLADGFWTGSRDGRTSSAYFGMIEALRTMREQGLPLSVFGLYDKPGMGDQLLADRLRRERLARPDALILTYTGNIHSMLKRADWFPAQIPTPMGALVADLHPVSIDLESDGGQSWSCNAPRECHVQDIPTPPVTRGPLFVAQPASQAGVYTLQVNVGRTTASPPAVPVAKP